MYKCTDCGKITKEKPQYCDCGNNIFEEVDAPQTGAPSSRDYGLHSGKNNFSLPADFDRLSVAIFVICLILAVIPWFFVLRPLPKNETKHSVKPVEVKKSLPDFESLWDDTPIAQPTPAPENIEPQTVEQPQTIIEYVTQIVQVPRREPKVTPPAPKPQSQTASQPKKEEVKQQPKPKTQTQNKPQTKDKPDVINRIEQKLAQNSAPSQKTENQQKSTVAKPQPKPQTPKPTAEELAALNQYRNNLRMILLSKLNVQSIIGEGECDIEFAIDSSGKLINRNFSKQSSNKTLNDAVYYMLMSVPVYQPPPKAYKGEMIRLHFYINNGYYEISFK